MGVRRRVPPTSSSRRSWPSSSSWNGPAEASCARPRSRASATTNRPKRWCAKVAKETSVEVQIDGQTLKLTNLEKVLYPEVGFTKAQVIDYYTRIAPVLLPHTHDHPLTLKRYPNGVDGEFFYEKNCPKHRPEWVETAKVWSGGNNRDMYYCLAQDLPTLVWLGNLATLEMHTSLSLCSNLPEPRTLVFDLDPGPPATIVECCRVGLMLRDVFAEHGLDCCAKTSGSKGLQLYVPLNTKVTYVETKVVSKGLAQRFGGKVPETTGEVSRPRVVIAGAGFAGLTCARALKGAPVDVLLVDRNNYHLFTPLLYQVASSLLDPGEIARPVRQLIRPLRNADFLQASVTGADLEGRRLLTDRGPLAYDYLVLATGATTDYF